MSQRSRNRRAAELPRAGTAHARALVALGVALAASSAAADPPPCPPIDAPRTFRAARAERRARSAGQSRRVAEGPIVSLTESPFDLLRGLDLAWEQHAQVMNLSLVGPPNPLLERAANRLDDLGAIVVAAAGNEGVAAPRYPAAYPSVVGVGAEVLSTVPGGAFSFASGTSFLRRARDRRARGADRQWRDAGGRSPRAIRDRSRELCAVAARRAAVQRARAARARVPDFVSCGTR